MGTTKLTRFVRSIAKRTCCVFGVVVVLFTAVVLLADPPADGRLKVLTMGLGTGRVTSSPAGINCTNTCEAVFPSSPDVEVTASPDAGSTFLGWDDADAEPMITPDCTGVTNPCRLTMNAHRTVRPVFGLVTPPTPIPVFDTTTSAPSTRTFGPGVVLAPNETIRPEDLDAYVRARTDLTPARFVAALPSEFKLNWILMSRSESLQTGTALSPRILLPSADGRFVFTIGMRQHSSYPGAHPNAIEFMQWDANKKNFRFHEVILVDIPVMDADGDGIGVIDPRPRAVRIDDDKCPRCHSTRNVLNPGSTAGTDGITPRSIPAKNKPNWDAYDSWAGMMSFNRDRIYQGSIEAAAFRKILNPWTWSTNAAVRQIIEQLRLQPAGTTAAHRITRYSGGPDDGHIRFAFDPALPSPPVSAEPAPSSSGMGDEATINTSYLFDRRAGMAGAETPVIRGGSFITLQHSAIAPNDEGRGVHFFDLLAGFGSPVPGDTATSNLNAQRVADEVINHHFATGSVPIEVRPITLAIAKGCLSISGTTVTSSPAHSIHLPFFNDRNGMTIDQVLIDTRKRAESLPLRKAGIQRFNLHRTGTGADSDPYTTGSDPVGGLMQEYASPLPGATPDFARLRQDIFRRPTRPRPCPVLLCPDNTVMGGFYVDREFHDDNGPKVALYRYFLEPLGVSVDKWSTGVRGRSRTYTFADVFDTFENTLIGEIEGDLGPPTMRRPVTHPISGLTSFGCSDLIPFLNTTLSASALLPGGVDAIPRYTDIQRIFNKSCVECHGGLDYPPYERFGGGNFDLSENERPPAGQDRLDRSYGFAAPFITTDPTVSLVYDRITDYQTLTHPYDPAAANENCPFGLMPCGGPPLSRVDIETIRRWIIGSEPNTRGDPHIETVDGVPYDFQSAGEFILLKGQGLEIQTRQTAIATDGPLGPNAHTGLSSCVSLNTAAAVRVGPHRITYEPDVNGKPNPEGLQLRIDGNLVRMSAEGILLESGGRIIQTTAPGGIQIEAPGGSVVVITPGWWDHYQVWYLNVDTRTVRATDGVMGAIAPGSWLPALPDGSSLGPRPRDLHQRYLDLYDRFENAWRVTDSTTLFDYAPGTSTATFTIANWPEEAPQRCVVPPPLPGGPVAKAPLKALQLEVAQQHCRGIVADNARANCIQDVMVTGEPKFAETYVRGEQIQRNGRPVAPELVFPDRFKTDLSASVDFTWNKSTDREGDLLTYRHCVWEIKEPFRLQKCIATSGQTSWWRGRAFYPLLIVLIGLLLLAILIFLGMRRRPWVLGFVVILIVVGVILAFYVNRTRSVTLARSVSGLQSGKAYYWKVIAEDGKGGTVESETRRFEIK
ncbi:MAG: hypothetical protein ACREBG_09730 [Pyrinomonadaceae bacterium]